MNDINKIQNKIRAGNWNEELIDLVIKTNNIDIYISALKTEDCPVDLILDLWQADNNEIRKLIFHHPNTPETILKELYKKDKFL